MRRYILVTVVLLALLGMSVQMVGGFLFTLKFLEPTDNAGSYTNEYSDSTATASAAGYTWHRYEVPAGTYDVYVALRRHAL